MTCFSPLGQLAQNTVSVAMYKFVSLLKIMDFLNYISLSGSKLMQKGVNYLSHNQFISLTNVLINNTSNFHKVSGDRYIHCSPPGPLFLWCGSSYWWVGGSGRPLWCQSPQWSSPALPLALAWAQMSLLLLKLTEERYVRKKPHINKRGRGILGGQWQSSEKMCERSKIIMLIFTKLNIYNITLSILALII